MNRAIKKAEKIEPLTRSERGMFKGCEGDIQAGRESFRKVGWALQEIRDNRYYREDFATFDDYLSKRWGFTRDYASKMITASDAAEGLYTKVDRGGGSVEVRPMRETQVRPLKALTVPRRKEAWAAAVEIAGGNVPSESQVRQAVKGLLPMGNSQAPASTMVDEAIPIRRALVALRSISKPSKNIKAAIDLLTREVEGGRHNETV